MTIYLYIQNTLVGKNNDFAFRPVTLEGQKFEIPERPRQTLPGRSIMDSIL